MTKNNNLNLQDLDGKIRAILQPLLDQYRADHPEVYVGMSAIMRMAIVEGAKVLQERHKATLGDKLTGGKLKK